MTTINNTEVIFISKSNPQIKEIEAILKKTAVKIEKPKTSKKLKAKYPNANNFTRYYMADGSKVIVE
jgi:hypothetical protein